MRLVFPILVFHRKAEHIVTCCQILHLKYILIYRNEGLPSTKRLCVSYYIILSGRCYVEVTQYLEGYFLFLYKIYNFNLSVLIQREADIVVITIFIAQTFCYRFGQILEGLLRIPSSIYGQSHLISNTCLQGQYQRVGYRLNRCRIPCLRLFQARIYYQCAVTRDVELTRHFRYIYIPCTVAIITFATNDCKDSLLPLDAIIPGLVPLITFTTVPLRLGCRRIEAYKDDTVGCCVYLGYQRIVLLRLRRKECSEFAQRPFLIPNPCGDLSIVYSPGIRYQVQVFLFRYIELSFYRERHFLILYLISNLQVTLLFEREADVVVIITAYTFRLNRQLCKTMRLVIPILILHRKAEHIVTCCQILNLKYILIYRNEGLPSTKCFCVTYYIVFSHRCYIEVTKQFEGSIFLCCDEDNLHVSGGIQLEVDVTIIICGQTGNVFAQFVEAEPLASGYHFQLIVLIFLKRQHASVFLRLDCFRLPCQHLIYTCIYYQGRVTRYIVLSRYFRSRDIGFCVPSTFVFAILRFTRNEVRFVSVPFQVNGLFVSVIEDHIDISNREAICINILTMYLLSLFLCSLTRPVFVSIATFRPNEGVYFCPIKTVEEINGHLVNQIIFCPPVITGITVTVIIIVRNGRIPRIVTCASLTIFGYKTNHVVLLRESVRIDIFALQFLVGFNHFLTGIVFVVATIDIDIRHNAVPVVRLHEIEGDFLL